MQLMPKQEAENLLKKEENQLKANNVRLLQFFSKGIKKLNSYKDNYSPDKEKAYKDFVSFCEDLNKKKSVLLKELKEISTLIEQKKDIYFAMLEKLDALDEKEQEIKQMQSKLDIREGFLIESEKKLKEKWDKLITA